MEFCVVHGRTHPEGETDSVWTCGDEHFCRTEEWPVVPGQVTASQCEGPAEEPEFLLTEGSLAYIDSFTGLVPAKVLSIEPTGDVEVRVTAGRPGWTRGEKVGMHVPNLSLISRDQVHRRNHQLYIRGAVSYLASTGDLL